MYRTMMTAPVFGLRREIDRLFEDTFTGSGDRAGWAPAVNIRETADGFHFDVELPGFRPEDVDLSCDNGVLMVRGERREERKEGDDSRYHLVERRQGEFTRSFQLPQGVRDDAIEAEFDNGLLRVRVPKAEIPQPRRIEIQGRGAARRDGQSTTHGSTSIRQAGATSENSGSPRKDGSARSSEQRGTMAGSGSR